MDDALADRPLDDDVKRALVENHRAFLAFLERRVGRRDVAEDLLQEAFARGLDKLATLRDGEAALGWFYRTLRNAVVDHHRRAAAEGRALERLAGELDPSAPAHELRVEACRCVLRLADSNPSTRVSGASGGQPQRQAFAEEAGLGRERRRAIARAKRRRQLAASCGVRGHGCFACTCASSVRRASPPEARSRVTNPTWTRLRGERATSPTRIETEDRSRATLTNHAERRRQAAARACATSSTRSARSRASRAWRSTSPAARCASCTSAAAPVALLVRAVRCRLRRPRAGAATAGAAREREDLPGAPRRRPRSRSPHARVLAQGRARRERRDRRTRGPRRGRLPRRRPRPRRTPATPATPTTRQAPSPRRERSTPARCTRTSARRRRGAARRAA